MFWARNPSRGRLSAFSMGRPVAMSKPVAQLMSTNGFAEMSLPFRRSST